MVRKRQSEKVEPSGDVSIDLASKVGFTPIGSSDYSEVKDFLPTFLPNVDSILGGGIPFGRITEVFAPEAVGKSTFMIYLTKIATKLGVDTFWIDTEGTSDPERMTELGVEVDKAFVFQPNNDKGENMDIETVQQKIEDIISAYDTPEYRERPVLIIWDSVGMTESRAESETAAGDKAQLGRQAAAVTAMIRKISPRIKTINMAFVAVNQIRANLQMMNKYDTKYTRPGGKALEHSESLRLELRKGTKIMQNFDEDKTPSQVGQIVHVITDKNKLERPKQRTDVVLASGWIMPKTKDEQYGAKDITLDGIDYVYNLYATGVELGILKTAGAYKKYVDPETGEVISAYELDWLRMIAQNDEFRRKLALEETKAIFTRKPPAYINNKHIDISVWDEVKPIADYYKGVTDAGE